MPGDGYWIRERLVWPDNAREETHHHFVLSRDLDPCGWRDLPEPPDTTGMDELAACEGNKAWHAAMAGLEVADALVFEFDLWDTTTSYNHIAIEPTPGSYTPLDGPDVDVVEFAFFGQRHLFDWYAEVAAHLDCEAEEPWANVASQLDSLTGFEAASGTLVLGEAVGDELPFELQQLEVVYDNYAVSPGGTLQGAGVFHACDVERYLDPPGVIY